MDKPDAWMPHYIGDYNMETIHLTAQQDGIYMRLRAFYWKKAGIVPTDLQMLYRAARATSVEERADVDYIVVSFFISDEKYIRHAELDKRYLDAWESYKRKSDAGKKAVAAREQKKFERLNDISNDEQTTAITRTRTEKEKKTYRQPVADQSPCEVDVSTRMSLHEFRLLHQQYFKSVMNENLNEQATNICRNVPKDRIEEVFRIVVENGINNFTYVLSNLENKSKL